MFKPVTLKNRDRENKDRMKLITKETIGFGDKAVRIQDCTNHKTDSITRLRENDIKLHVEHRLCCVTYGPVIGIRCMVHREYTKHRKVIHQAIWCKIVGRDDSDEALLLIPYNLVVNTGGNNELYQRKDKLKLSGRDIDIICIGVYQDKYAVCSFKYV